MTKLTKVTMNLTDRDVENAERLYKKLHARSKAEAVSAALSITRSLADLAESGGEIMIKSKKGELGKVIIPGING